MKENKERAERTEINGIMKSIPVIRKLMEEQNLNQKKLGELFGYSQSNINKCLKQGFTLPMLYRIAEHFDLSLDYLTGRRSSGMSETERRFKERARELLNFIAFARDKRGLPVNVRADGAGPLEITYDRAAERLGMTPEELRKYLEKNDVSCFLTMEQIEKLADFFHVSLDYLFNRDTGTFSVLEKSEIAERLARDQYVSVAEVAADGRVYPAFYFPEDSGREKQGLFSRQTKLCHNIAINKYLKNCMDARQKLKDELYDQETYNTVMEAYRKQLRQRLLDPLILTSEVLLESAITKKAEAGQEPEKTGDGEPEDGDESYEFDPDGVYLDEEKRAEAEFSRYANPAASGTENKDS